MRNQSGLLAVGSRPAYTGKPQAAHKKIKDKSDMEALVLTSTPGTEIIAGPPASFPCAMKRSSMLANHCVSHTLEEEHISKSVLCFTLYFLLS